MLRFASSAAALLLPSCTASESYHERLDVHPIAPPSFGHACNDATNATRYLLQATWVHSIDAPSLESRVRHWGAFPRSIAALFDGGDGASTDLRALHLSLTAGAWDHEGLSSHGGYQLPGDSNSTNDAHEAPHEGPPGITIQAEFDGASSSTEYNWDALLTRLSSPPPRNSDVAAARLAIAGGGGRAFSLGLPLGTGLNSIDDSGTYSYDGPATSYNSTQFSLGDYVHHTWRKLMHSATASGRANGIKRRWYTHTVTDPAHDVMRYSLSFPATPGLGTGAGLPWRQLAKTLLSDLDTCGAVSIDSDIDSGTGDSEVDDDACANRTFGAGLASVFAPSLVERLTSHRNSRLSPRDPLATYVSLGLSVTRECGGNITSRTCRLVLERRLTVILQAASASASSSSSTDMVTSLPHLLGLHLPAAPSEASASTGCGEKGDKILLGSCDVGSDDIPLSRGGIAVHSEAASDRPAIYPLSQFFVIPIPKPVTRTDRVAAVRLVAARRQLTQRRLGHGVLVNRLTIRLPPTAASGSGGGSGGSSNSAKQRYRVLVLTPAPWFLGLSELNGSSQAAHSIIASRGSYARVAVSATVSSDALDFQRRTVTFSSDVIAEAWLHPTAATASDDGRGVAASDGYAIADLSLAAGKVLPPVLRGRPGLHAAVLDVTVALPPASVQPDNSSGSDEFDERRRLTLSLSIPWTSPTGLLHAEECPPDAHRGLDLPPGSAWLDDVSGRDDTAASDALEHIARCFTGTTTDNGVGDLRRRRCPPHPADLTPFYPYSPTSPGGFAAGFSYLNALTVEPPCPDFSMPYNAIVLVATAAAFVLGTFINITARKPRKPAALAVSDAVAGARLGRAQRLRLTLRLLWTSVRGAVCAAPGGRDSAAEAARHEKTD